MWWQRQREWCENQGVLYGQILSPDFFSVGYEQVVGQMFQFALMVNWSN
jgi:hypothetical protein